MHKILSPLDLNFAAEALLKGELVAFPTETVYGLGGNAFDDGAVAKIFLYKNRSEFNPISVCYKSLDDADPDVDITDLARLISAYFLPGAITLLLKRKPLSRLSWLCSAGLDVVGVRIPSSDVAINLLKKLPFPLAAPSANRSTEISPTSAQIVSESLKFNDNLIIIDDGKSQIGIESTIIDLTSVTPCITRIGVISADDISKKIGIDIAITNSKNTIKHYQTKKTLIINALHADPADALLAFGEPFHNSCKYLLNLSDKKDLNEAAANLFSMLHQLDQTDANKICVMPILNEGIGIAINSRLNEAII